MSREDLRLAAVMIVVLLTIYLPAIRSGYVWDDDVHVTDNLTLRSAEGLEKIWFQPDATAQYYPLVFTSFWVDYHLWGLHPLGYHIVNVLLHGLNALLVWLLLRRLLIPGAWLAAAVFAVHPVHVESVAWITERKNVLSGFFYLAAFLAYLRFQPPEPEAPPKGRWRWYSLAMLLFFAALLSKTVTCSLPAALVLVLWWKRRLISSRILLPLAPFFLLGLVLGLYTAWVEKHYIGALGGEWSLSWIERVLIAGRALWFYAAKLVAPLDLTFVYPRWVVQPRIAWQYLFPVAALGSIAGLWLARTRLGRGPLVAALFFGGTLVPALGIFDTYPMRFSFVADHFQYLASLGLIALAAAAAADAARRIGLRVTTQALLAAPVLLALATASWRQTAGYADARTLWTYTLASNPDCWIAENNLGLIFYQEGNTGEALRHYARALAIHPHYAEAQYNMGLALAQQGRLAEAQEHLALAATLRPDYPDTHFNLGLVLARQGKLAQAEEHLLRAAAQRPEHAETHLNLGVVLAQQGRMADAVAQLTEAVRLDPGSKGAIFDLGLALLQVGEPGQAAAQFTAAVRIDPSFAEAHEQLGWIRARQGEWSSAALSFREAAAARPAVAGLRYAVGVALQHEGRVREAAVQFQEARQADPTWPEAAARLAWLLSTDPDDAMRDGLLALQLAREATQAMKDPGASFLDTLAAAYAEVGRYEDASTTAQRAFDQAVATQQTDLAQGILLRKRSYESHRPFRRKTGDGFSKGR